MSSGLDAMQLITTKVPKLDDQVHNHECVVANNKLWIFSKKFYNQPTYHYGHHVLNKGGYVLSFDMQKKNWTEPTPYHSLSTEEDLSEIVFVHEGKVCVLLYSHFGKIVFRQLAVFDETEQQFTMWNEFEAEKHTIKSSDEPDNIPQKCILADGTMNNGNRVFLIAVGEHLHTFSLALDMATRTAHFQKLSQTEHSDMSVPIHAIIANDNLYLEFALRGCSVSWKQNELRRISLKDGSLSNITIDGEHPKFQFSGARLLHFDKKRDSVLHATGLIMKGMTSSEYLGEFWELENISTDSPKWRKLSFELPEGKDALLALEASSRALFVVDRQRGLFTLSM